MGILDIKPAERSGSRVVIGISGQSGSGKTYSALKLARGMVDSPSEIGFLDTENGRGRLYSNILDGKFLHADLYAPFSPARYRQAIEEFQKAGVKVLVIDSGSHEWEGEGGCSDIADQPLLNGKKMADWKRAKAEHKKFMSALLQSNMHIIVCLRARNKTDFSNPKDPMPLGLHPVCEKDFMFEMTVSMMMYDNGKVQDFTKLPEELRPIFFESGRDSQHHGYIGEAHGRGLIKWVESGVKIDEEFEHWRSKLQMTASRGVAALNAEAANIPDSVKKKIREIWLTLKSSAEEYERIESFINDESPAAVTITPQDDFNPAKLQKADAPVPSANEEKPSTSQQNIENF
ncbi:P-loop containing nucleoside triphosphate hydrolase [Klebsiella phage vB_KpnS_MK54]|uniref:P-loop containing nucleoside triphosphate hydrolase n=1 Tax=Klebsiella phage vB_KpnS_MK54 TaxID=2783667 RepID=UPI001CE6123A|nr:P-loop containing nucleoside triphosphate hydrolase [Klebsiella phage vB_KpnS_MK54]QZD26085.1 P-loop containing nucleoside triphosphate hydrolase [Klebsiella phage vB_KpnS_MK54]